MPGWEHEVQRKRIINSDRSMNRLPGIHQDRLVKFRGQWYITTESLTFCGYTAVEVGDVIRVQGKAGDLYWEIEGRAAQKGIDPGHPRYIAGWWIRRLVIPNFDDLTPEEFIRGGQET